MVWLLIESNVLRKIVILPSSTLKVRPSIRWFHILSFTTLPSLKMGALPPWNPGCRFNQARYRGWSYPSASPPIHSHPFAELRILSDVLLQVRQKYPQYMALSVGDISDNGIGEQRKNVLKKMLSVWFVEDLDYRPDVLPEYVPHRRNDGKLPECYRSQSSLLLHKRLDS